MHQSKSNHRKIYVQQMHSFYRYRVTSEVLSRIVLLHNMVLEGKQIRKYYTRLLWFPLISCSWTKYPLIVIILPIIYNANLRCLSKLWKGFQTCFWRYTSFRKYCIYDCITWVVICFYAHYAILLWNPTYAKHTKWSFADLFDFWKIANVRLQ